VPSFFTDTKREDLLVYFVIVLPDSTAQGECLNQKSLKPTAKATLRYSERTSLPDKKTLKRNGGACIELERFELLEEGGFNTIFPAIQHVEIPNIDWR